LCGFTNKPCQTADDVLGLEHMGAEMVVMVNSYNSRFDIENNFYGKKNSVILYSQ
jgi:hypothetical protein